MAILDKPARPQVWLQPASKQKRAQKRLGTSLVLQGVQKGNQG